MDYEEKYKESLSKARSLMKDYKERIVSRDDMEEIFPELKEGEDEKIRKTLIEYFNAYPKDYYGELKKSHILAWLEKQGEHKESYDTCISTTSNNKKIPYGEKRDFGYFEKQGEQKPFDYENANIQQKDFAPKIEPKFKVGDWVTNSIETVQITGYDIDYGYQVDCKGNLQHRDTDIIEKEYYLWTIQDAKDGDVLACENGLTCIFKCLNDNLFCSHCFMDNEGWFCEDGGQAHTLDERICGEIHPATKEQRAMLFAKMKEDGYEWDADKRELRKIEQKPVEWSEEDMKMIGSIRSTLELDIQRDRKIPEEAEAHKKELKWFDELYERGLSVKPMWSEEDKKHLQALVGFFSGEKYFNVKQWTEKREWLKSILINPKQESNKDEKKELINKACGWLKENVKYYSHPKYQGEELTDETYIAEQLFYDFRKAMEEE